ncbi:MAG: hypothetical protein QOE70_836 [Chthoniobacter sp.]|jgi:DNA-binding NtrC family response regulator|nr:hypothetical protein [Chthoniobacter sp.]
MPPYKKRMARPKTAGPSQGDTIALIARAGFANPFSEEFAIMCRQIAGREITNEAELRAMMRETVDRVVGGLESSGQAHLAAHQGERRAELRMVFLFQAYQQFHGALDQLVLDQVALGDAPAPVPFAREVLALLARRGFEEEEARRCFAIFFQIRRAHHFIGHGLLGRSPCMGEFRRHLWQNVFTHDIRSYERRLWDRMEDFSTLLFGETGTGKGAAAAAIGRSSFIPFDERKQVFVESFTRNFVALNLSQYPETLIESELFGHRKGAFTGAVESHQGVFARGSTHGAIFLDEIGDVSMPVQIKLLQVLEDRWYSPVGSHERARFSGRVIAATHRPLAELRQRGVFRDDFYYRLCSDTITVPPLRQRLREEPGELAELVGHLLHRMTGEVAEHGTSGRGEPGEAAAELAAPVTEALRQSPGHDYAWPGNVRELEQAVRRVLITRRYEGDRPHPTPDPCRELIRAMESGTLDADRLLSGYCALLYDRCGNLEAVARQTNLDRRTVKKYVHQRRGH